MSEDRKKEPGERLNDILSADDEDKDEKPLPGSQPQALSQSPLDKLPRVTKYKIMSEAQAETQTTSPQPPQPDTKPAPVYKQKWGPPFWTITGILSLAVNGVLIAILLILLSMLGPLQGTAGNLGTEILGGLFSNFEKMDRATIQTVIPVDAEIPLNITVPVRTTTQITLSETVAIPNAQVQINTGGVAINSNARVTLPAGTPLTVNLNFDLPVQTTIPINLKVPVNIPMAETELHEPFVGLQDVIQPLYCFVDPNATNLNGQVICQ